MKTTRFILLFCLFTVRCFGEPQIPAGGLPLNTVKPFARSAHVRITATMHCPLWSVFNQSVTLRKGMSMPIIAVLDRGGVPNAIKDLFPSDTRFAVASITGCQLFIPSSICRLVSDDTIDPLDDVRVVQDDLKRIEDHHRGLSNALANSSGPEIERLSTLIQKERELIEEQRVFRELTVNGFAPVAK